MTPSADLLDMIHELRVHTSHLAQWRQVFRQSVFLLSGILSPFDLDYLFCRDQDSFHCVKVSRSTTSRSNFEDMLVLLDCLSKLRYSTWDRSLPSDSCMPFQPLCWSHSGGHHQARHNVYIMFLEPLWLDISATVKHGTIEESSNPPSNVFFFEKTVLPKLMWQIYFTIAYMKCNYNPFACSYILLTTTLSFQLPENILILQALSYCISENEMWSVPYFYTYIPYNTLVACDTNVVCNVLARAHWFDLVHIDI